MTAKKIEMRSKYILFMRLKPIRGRKKNQQFRRSITQKEQIILKFGTKI